MPRSVEALSTLTRIVRTTQIRRLEPIFNHHKTRLKHTVIRAFSEVACKPLPHPHANPTIRRYSRCTHAPSSMAIPTLRNILAGLSATALHIPRTGCTDQPQWPQRQFPGPCWGRDAAGHCRALPGPARPCSALSALSVNGPRMPGRWH